MRPTIMIISTLLLSACTSEQLGSVADASDKRRIVCEFIARADLDNPTVAAAKRACDAGRDLDAIARAYGGCEVEAAE